MMNARQDKRFILTFSALLYIKIMQNSSSQRGDLTGILVAKEKKLVALAIVLVAVSSHAMEPALTSVSGFCSVKQMRVFDSPWMGH